MKKKHLRALFFSILFLGIGLGGMKLFIVMKKSQIKHPPDHKGALVETVELQKVDVPLNLRTQGTVQAKRAVDLVSQVKGIVKLVSDRFVAGGYFKEGDILFEVETIDFELSRERAVALVAKAELDVAMIESQARVAWKEWQHMEFGKEESPNPLVVFEPQLKSARASLAAAKADVEQHDLNIQRSQVRAPFNCMVKQEKLEIGQLIMAGQVVGQIRGTDFAEVVCPITFEEMAWLEIPRKGSHGSKAKLEIQTTGQSFSWQGSIVRLLGEVDPQGRMLRVVLEVADPYGLTREHSGEMPFLAEGLFVNVALEGELLKGVFEIPSSALREKQFIWVMNKERKLELRKVVIVRNQGPTLIVRGDFHSGEQLVLTYLPGAAPGTLLRTLLSENDKGLQ